MKKIFFLVFISNFVFCQNLEVKFKFHQNKSYDLVSTIKNFKLIQNEKASTFVFDDIRNISQIKNKEYASVYKENDSLVIFLMNGESFLFLEKEQIYKNFEKNFLIADIRLEMKSPKIYIEDKIDIFNWEIINNKDTLIGGFNCKIAKTNFRGRDYIAYFSNEIANYGGPWKFDGLPGFILKVESLDGYLLIEPVEIIRTTSTEIPNPFINKKTTLFTDLSKLLLEKDKKYLARTKSLPNPPERIVVGKPDMIEDTGLGERVYE